MPYLLQQTSPLSTWECLSQHAQQYSSRTATRTAASSRGARRPPVAVPSHKSMPTCTVSLAHAEVVSAPVSDFTSISEIVGQPDFNFAPQLSVHQPTLSSRTTSNYRSNQVNVIPFPMLSTESSLPPAISSRPLPIPPKSSRMNLMDSLASSFNVPQVRTLYDPETRRTRRESLSSLPASDTRSRVVAPVMQRRRSRDPNVSDRLVVEADDADAMPPRPNSPSPEPHDQANRGRKAESAGNASPTSPDQSAPPAYSTLPPPYSPTNSEEKKDGEEQLLLDILGKEDQPSVTATTLPLPRTHKASIPSSRTSASMSSSSSAGPSSYKRTRVSTSELKVLLYLYRTVVYGLEMRRRKEKESALLSGAEQEPLPEDASKTKRKPLGPRSSCSTSPIPRAGTVIPEDKYQFENSIASAVSAKVMGKLKHSHRGFGSFPLVEDDLDAPEPDVEAVDYITPRTPFHSPSQSPRSTPPPILRPLSPIPGASDLKPKQKEKAKVELNTELDVQDKLLSIRLRDFLMAQGVCEDDLTVEFDGENEEGAIEKAVDEVETEIKAAPQVLTQDEVEENNILEEYFMGIEEEEDPRSAKKERGPVVEDDDEVVASKVQAPFIEDLDMDMGDCTSTTLTASPPPLQVMTHPAAVQTQRISSPPPASPSPRPRAVLPTSYMVALLTMRNRHPSKKPSSSNSGGSVGDKNKEGAGKRKSGLSIVVEAD